MDHFERYNRRLLERQNTHELLDYLKSEHGEEIRQKLILVLERKLGLNDTPLSVGTKDSDRLERFFDIVLDVESLPPVPYTAEELLPIVQSIAADYRTRVPDEDEDAALYEEDAQGFDAMAALLQAGDLTGARKLHARMDTYTRGQLFIIEIGADEERYYGAVYGDEA